MMSLEMQLQETQRLVSDIENKESDDEGDSAISPAKQEAKNKLMELKSTLQDLKEQVLSEAGVKHSNHHARRKHRLPQTRARKVTSWVNQIARKIPVITQLEKRLGMLQGLDPVLESIVADLDQVTDFSHMITLGQD